MAGAFWWLLFLSVVITSTSIAAGILPLALSLSRKRIQAISSFGMGLLVGTSLIIIIPEGVSTMYSAYAPEEKGHHETGTKSIRTLAIRADSEPKADDHDDHAPSPERYVGLALVLGFVFMYLINALSTLTNNSNERGYSTISVNALRSFPTDEPANGPAPSKRSFSTTLGLMIHAMADGIALGASANSSRPSLGIIVFFAIMLHKAPAAFGLVAILLKQGLSKRHARAHLVAFSLAAPVGAFATWIVINLLGGTGDSTQQHQHTEWWTGLLLLFSAGTFLFVAMHAMQEMSAGPSHHSPSHNGELRMQDLDMVPEEDDSNKIQNSLLTTVGMLAPLITYLGPHHAH
ncbi:hypothetical protein ABW19_dt0207997 [Dactylella cylindrospora]|nr:hypothetical protein ABW19_dt0207997 [Dactylella cylindrospora]